MAVYTGEINFSTPGEIEVRDITHDVMSEVKKSGFKDGIACIFVPGATGAITTIEFEDGLVTDIKTALERLFLREWNTNMNFAGMTGTDIHIFVLHSWVLVYQYHLRTNN